MLREFGTQPLAYLPMVKICSALLEQGEWLIARTVILQIGWMVQLAMRENAQLSVSTGIRLRMLGHLVGRSIPETASLLPAWCLILVLPAGGAGWVNV
jgi:hypothetical protein